MPHSPAMEAALAKVRDAARQEMLGLVPVTVFGLNLNQVRLLIDFYERSTGREASEIAEEKVSELGIIFCPNIMAGRNAVAAHRANPTYPRFVYVTPDNLERIRGLDRATSWTFISMPHSRQSVEAFRQIQARFGDPMGMDEFMRRVK